MVAEATVYFPSIPEITPTNPVITLVQNVVANSQQVETDRGTPVDITLSGYSPTGNPLVYAISEEPFNGSLNGTPPNLTFSPADDFGGLDWFAFTVSDEVDTSRPAVVTIIVNFSQIYLP